MQRSDISIKRLTLFQMTANLGSVQAVSDETGLSISTVSYHLSGLEDELGVALLDHKRRPMALTPEGVVYLKHVEQVLHLMRRARAEATSGKAVDTRSLRLGLIEDFDSEIAPELAVHLAEMMPRCDFAHHTRFSHENLALLRARKLDICVAAGGGDQRGEASERPLLRDPFVLAVPAQGDVPVAAYLDGTSGLPFLRYSAQQMIGTQIETQLRRLRLSLPHRFEIESNQTMMAMIGAGAGWAITTPLCYFRARRFHGQVRLQPFPGKGFARSLSLFATPGCSDAVIDLVDTALRNLIDHRVIRPAREDNPWISDSLRLVTSD